MRKHILNTAYQWTYSQTISMLMTIFLFRLYEMCELNRSWVSSSQWEVVYLRERNMRFSKIQMHFHQSLLWALPQFLPAGEWVGQRHQWETGWPSLPQIWGGRNEATVKLHAPVGRSRLSAGEWRLGQEVIFVENECMHGTKLRISPTSNTVAPIQTDFLPGRTDAERNHKTFIHWTGGVHLWIEGP